MREDRHIQRRETLAFWPAHDSVTGELISTVADLTEEGLMLHSSRPYRVEEVLDIRLIGIPQMEFHLINMWCKENETENLYHAGFRITHLSDASRVGIRDLLQAFSYPAPKQD